MFLVDDPACRAITDGDLLLGWEGDPAVALFIDPEGGLWDLLRLCPDRTYRSIHRAHWIVVGAADVAGYMVAWLASHDARRGYDVVAEIDKANARAERQSADGYAEQVHEDLGPRLYNALQRDGLAPRDRWGQAGLPKPEPEAAAAP